MTQNKPRKCKHPTSHPDICWVTVCGWCKTLFLTLEFTGRTDGCLKWATRVDEKWKVTQTLLQTSLELAQMYHLGDINYFTFQPHIKSQWLPNKFQNETAQLLGPVEKGMTGLSRHRDVIPKFSPAWDPPHSPLCKVSTLWTLRAPLTSALPMIHWFSPERLSRFNSPSPTPSSVPPPRRFLEKTSFLQFYKQKTHLIWSSNWTSLEANGRRVRVETRKE